MCKVCLEACTKSWDIRYESLLITMTHLPSLEARRQQAKLCNLYIINDLTHFPDAPVINREQPYARSHTLVAVRSHSNQHCNWYFPSTINAWNSLPSEIQTISSANFSHLMLGYTFCTSFGYIMYPCIMQKLVIENYTLSI